MLIARSDITGVVLAGGRGSRMGGTDKGLQQYMGLPLALHTLRRLQPQVGPALISANRNLAEYEAFGVPVCPDVLADYPGPLAGFLAALERCETPWLITVPCDTPLFPSDLVARLAKAAHEQESDIAMAAAHERPGGPFRAQPVFCLLRVSLRKSLAGFLERGDRKVEAWTSTHRTVIVPFDESTDDAGAFANANTLDELHRLEQAQ